MKIATKTRKHKEILIFSREDTRRDAKRNPLSAPGVYLPEGRHPIPAFPQYPIAPILIICVYLCNLWTIIRVNSCNSWANEL